MTPGEPIFTDAELAELHADDAATEWRATVTAVTWPRRRCPACGSEKLKTTRSVAMGDGTRMRRVRCRTCGHAFAAFLE